MNYTEKILDCVEELISNDMPGDIQEFINDCIVDYLGVTFAGAYENKEKTDKYIGLIGGDAGGVYPIGSNHPMPVTEAAMINGIHSHLIELDDGSRFGMVHLGTVIFSVLFAMIQKKHFDALHFYKATLTGYEVIIRLSRSVQPSHKKSGFHATGTCGCIGAALALCAAYDMNRSEMKRVISAAAASASGLLEMISNTSELKPFNAGKAAANAVEAFFIGGSGYEGPADPIGGERGLASNMGGSINDEYWSVGLENYYIKTIYRKPYASCRHCHPSVEAILKLKENNTICVQDIEKIAIETYNLAIKGHDHTSIEGIGSAKMSIPYSVAAALLFNEGGIKAFSEKAIKDETILSLTKKVEVVENKDFSAMTPEKRISKVNLFMKDGSNESMTVEYPKGEPENPMSRDELINKYRQLSEYAKIAPDLQDSIQKNIFNLNNRLEDLLKNICGEMII